MVLVTLSVTAIKYRLKKLVKEYHNQIYVKAHQTTKKHDKNCSCPSCVGSSRESRRKLERNWKMKNDVLFDIGFDMDKLEGKEKLFYEDQENKWEGQLDKHVNVEYEQQQELKQPVEVERLQRLKLEEDYIMSPFEDAQEPDTMNSTVLSVSDENSI